MFGLMESESRGQPGEFVGQHAELGVVGRSRRHLGGLHFGEHHGSSDIGGHVILLALSSRLAGSVVVCPFARMLS